VIGWYRESWITPIFPTKATDEMTEAVEAFSLVAGVVKTKWQVAEAEAARAMKSRGPEITGK
jgi:hypothetical protein